MANEKNINSRIQLKHDVEANWYAAGTAAKPFIPKAGEVIIYDPDDVYENIRTKVGDGSTPVHLLKWASGCDESVGLTITYFSNRSSARLMGIGDCTDDVIIVPRGYNGVPVANIGQFVTEACKEIIIPNSVTSISSLAFIQCPNLKRIFIPKSNLTIEEIVFANCSPDMIIYCGLEQEPAEWTNTDWNYGNYPVIWGATRDVLKLNEKIGDISSALDYLIAQTEDIIGQKYYIISEEVSETGEEEEMIDE